MFHRVVLVALAVLISGCISYLDVSKVSSAEDQGGESVDGIRYSLPQPFLSVKPAQAGGIEVEVVYLPDPTNEYAVDSQSFLSANKFDVQIEKGLLKQVVFNPDSSAVARQLVESAGNLAKAEIEAGTEAAKKRADARAAAQKVVADAQGELLKARKKLEGLEALKAQGVAGLEDTIKAARIAVVDAEAGVAKAEEASRAGGFNAPASSRAATRPTLPQAWGPVLFRIVETNDGVGLQAIDNQHLFDTYKPQTKTAPRIPRLGIDGSATVTLKEGRLQLLVASDVALENVRFVKLLDDKNTDTLRVLSQSHQVDPKKIVVDLDPATPPGPYKLSVAYTFNGKVAAQDIELRVAK